MANHAYIDITDKCCPECGRTLSRPMGERDSHPECMRDSVGFDVCLSFSCGLSPFSLEAKYRQDAKAV